jgi:hypothetical protein
MERRRQTFEEIISNLSRIESEWKDDHAKSVMDLLDGIEEKASYTIHDLQQILDKDYEAGMTLIRLFLDLSKDELTGSMREIETRAYRKDPDRFLQGLASLGALEKMREAVGTPVTWRDILAVRHRRNHLEAEEQRSAEADRDAEQGTDRAHLHVQDVSRSPPGPPPPALRVRARAGDLRPPARSCLHLLDVAAGLVGPVGHRPGAVAGIPARRRADEMTARVVAGRGKSTVTAGTTDDGCSRLGRHQHEDAHQRN